jgi:2-polyprenyl-3-methyl-5-hydroxy-6-metoxy-1,4-benzoquinol methylase
MIESEDVRMCYVCGSHGARLYSGLRDSWVDAPGTWNVLACRRCRLAWLDPRPAKGQLHKLYGAGYYTHLASSRSSDEEGMLRRVAGLALRSVAAASQEGPPPRLSRLENFMARHLRRCLPLRDVLAGSVMWLESDRPGRLLDVGCGDGVFLARMHGLGWDVHGVEPDSAAAAAAGRRHHLRITTATVEDAALPPASFDVITMSHVLEHVHDPVEVLVECRRLLKPGGRLIVATPNAESLGRVVFRRRWMHWDIPRHLFVFSTRNLKRCGQIAGLEIEELRTSARSAFFSLPHARFRPTATADRRRGTGGWHRMTALLFWALELVFLAIQPRCGEELVMKARRA